VSESGLKLARAPIVEAVLDIDCDLPPGQEIAKLEASAKKRFSDRYPTVRTVFIQQHEIQAKPDSEAKMLIRRGIQAFQFMQKDEKQLVQVRAQGFSFNRLAPYSSLDDYLSEIERTWRLYLTLSSPVQARVVRLRYINRMMLPAAQGRLELNDYLKISPRLPEEDKLTFLGFLNQYAAEDAATGNQANIVMAAQPMENDKAPIIFDITVASHAAIEAANWPAILSTIQSLRDLKNRIFRHSLTERCIKVFQQ